MIQKQMLAIGLGVALAAPALAQKCDTSKSETAPMSRFSADAKGAVKDTRLNKTWLRCAIGMRWNGNTCEGQTLTYRWNDALSVIEEMNQKKVAGRSNWRLPTVDELESITEKRCFKPAINLEAFPYSPESGFWTDTRSEGVQPRAWVVHFLNGKRYVAHKKQDWRVRLIAD